MEVVGLYLDSVKQSHFKSEICFVGFLPADIYILHIANLDATATFATIFTIIPSVICVDGWLVNPAVTSDSIVSYATIRRFEF